MIPQESEQAVRVTLEALRQELAAMPERTLWILAGAAALLMVSIARVTTKAGFSWSVGLLMALPPFVLVAPLFLALAPWPARRELRAMRAVQRVVHRAEQRRLAS